MKPYALDYTLSDWKNWCCEHSLPGYSADQIYQWIFQKGSLSPERFTNLPLSLRERLADSFSWELPKVDTHLVSIDKSEKYLLKTFDDELFEMVLMPYDNRVTLCVSSQVGCKMGCTFCQTGKMGLKRNLSSGEILSQILIANQHYRVTNVVFMGMGEPLDNFDEVIKACQVMIDEKGLNLSKTKVTVSTSGLVPEIRRLGESVPVRLAISLHNANDGKRSQMMPVNRRYPLPTLKEALIDYPAPKRFGITIEYVMIEGENDSVADAKNLVRFLTGFKAKVNLIPINHFPGMAMKASEQERIDRFQTYLIQKGVPASVRYSKGQDISGGCGQLASKREDELNIDPRLLEKERRKKRRAASLSLY